MTTPNSPSQTEIVSPTLRGRSEWWIVVCGGLLLASSHGLVLSAFGAYLVTINADTGWDPRIVAVSYSLVQLGNGLLAPVAGWCCDRVGTRLMTLAGAVVSAVGFLAAAQTQGPSQFVAAVALIALGGAGIGFMPATVAVVRAFAEPRTLAIGLLSTGSPGRPSRR